MNVSPAPFLLGMFVQVEGDRMFLDRHLVIENAETKPVDEMIAYLSVDGYWCALLPHCKATDCESCLTTYRLYVPVISGEALNTHGFG